MSAGRCKHFTGLMNDACRAGVKYLDVAVENPPPGVGRSFPCLLKYNHAGATCEKCDMPSPAEVAEEEREHKRLAEAVGKARAAIVAHLGPWKRGKVNSASGRIDCPVCGAKGALAFRRAGYNGHVAARCSTAGCCDWME